VIRQALEILTLHIVQSNLGANEDATCGGINCD
jgi:hypothetical protein